MYHNLLNHSLIAAHLDYFQFLAIKMTLVNIAKNSFIFWMT